jgi:hypothetical protein
VVEANFKDLLEQILGRRVYRIHWSEQGMQPKGGWHFDVELDADPSPSPGVG